MEPSRLHFLLSKWQTRVITDLFWNVNYECVKRYFSIDVTALAPSAAAVMTCLSCFVRMSPAANMPGVDVTPLSSAIRYPCSSRVCHLLIRHPINFFLILQGFPCFFCSFMVKYFSRSIGLFRRVLCTLNVLRIMASLISDWFSPCV